VNSPLHSRARGLELGRRREMLIDFLREAPSSRRSGKKESQISIDSTAELMGSEHLGIRSIVERRERQENLHAS